MLASRARAPIARYARLAGSQVALMYGHEMRETTDSSPLPASSPALTLGLCARCGDAVDVRARHLAIDGPSVRVYCSQRCAEARTPAPAPPPRQPRRAPLARLARAAASLPVLVLTSGSPSPPSSPPLPAAIAVPQPTPPEPPRFGPSWPPTEKDWLAEIATDAWIHPLDGPLRRMPIRDARTFGAERPGDRPAECRGGHCGVDLGGEAWGEPIHVVHDGVVDRVQRGPNEEHGGLYVRVAHRNGTIFSQYFHLAAIPRWIQPGLHVKMGDIIGLLGDTGVKRSTAHLHFTISVKPAAQVNEQYIDPEPLVALWPLRISVSGGAMVTASAAPGVPLGARPRHRRSHPLEPPPDGASDVAASE
jgi:murein DD-endopeptidase MepM/ murein hydrolase activator NlpD